MDTYVKSLQGKLKDVFKSIFHKQSAKKTEPYATIQMPPPKLDTGKAPRQYGKIDPAVDKAAMKALPATAQAATTSPATATSTDTSTTTPRKADLQYGEISSFKKGGEVKKTGIYKLHEGEEVLNKKDAMAHRMTVRRRSYTRHESLPN